MRGLIRTVLLGVVPAIAVIVGAHYYVASGQYVTTENAYVKAHLVAISAEVSGRVDQVFVAENALVRSGDLLFSIDPKPFRIEFESAEASLAMVRNDVDALRADYWQADIELKEAKANIAYFDRVFRRQRTLVGRGHASKAKFDEARRNLTTSRQRASALRQKALQILARLGGAVDLAVEGHPDYLAALAKRDMAELDLRRSMVYAPTDGFIGRIRLQRGEYVRAGESVLPMVETGELWIEANLKETQLTDVQVGQTAEVVVDAYPDHTWIATVKSISPSTGAEFAILPPQNASGNWVKVVQRVPVRLSIDTVRPALQMRAGMTVRVTIDTEREHSLLDLIGSALAWKADGE